MTNEAKVILAVTKEALPEIKGEDLHTYIDSFAGRCRPVLVSSSPSSLRFAYYVDGQTALGRLRLVPKALLENGEEHWLATFHWGPKGGRQHRSFRVVGKMSWKFASVRELIGK